MLCANRTAEIEQAVQLWLQEVVVGLNLCPFAVTPLRRQRVRLSVTNASSEQQLIAKLRHELVLLNMTETTELETTLVIIPRMLANFVDFNQFLAAVDALLLEHNWQGVFQVASFHPNYCFAGVCSAASENLTNRSPYPILHILRESSVTAALQNFPAAERIPINNISKIRSLSLDDRRRCFPYLGLEE